MEGTVAVIEKYKARLNPDSDFKKVFRALQKLNEIEMTIDLLQATGVGRKVNSLRKTEGLGEFVKEIINKWKRLRNNGTSETSKRRSPAREYAPSVKTESCEYDPTQNWKMKKTSSYKPSVKQENIDDEEYDPSKNWQMESSSSNDARNEQYLPSASPVKIKTEKLSPTRSKKKKRRENGKRAGKNSDPEIGRKAELLDTLQTTQKELTRLEDKNRKSKVKVKVEKESPDRRSNSESVTENGQIDEYDPQSNFELENSLPINGPESLDSDEGRDPLSRHESEEYDPGPGDSDVNYKPSSNLTYNPESSWVNDREEDDDSEASYEENEPGAYLLHPRRASSDLNRRSSENSEGNVPQNVSDSFVQSTTLYSRNKSVDSEDGTWGSRVNGIKVEKNIPYSTEKTKRSSDGISSKDCMQEKVIRIKTEETDGALRKKHKNSKKDKNLVKIKREPESNSDKNSKKVTQKNKTKASSEKRKLCDEKDAEPVRKKAKKSKDVGDKSEVKDAGFLFENIPDLAKTKKKKQKKTKVANTSVNSKTSEKLNLHLPKIQTTYRPLPHPSDRSSGKRKIEEFPLTDNQAAELHSKRQTKKMLVYSGGGGGFIPKMMSLYDQCMGVLMNNIDAIDVFGGIPYDILQPILKKCTPEQLYRLEDSNPYLLDDTDALWEQHSQHEFRGHKPEELESWREMFLRLSDEREAKLLTLTQMIQAKEAKKKPLEKKVMLAYVGSNAKAPRSVRRAQEKYGTGVRPRPVSGPSTSGSVAAAVRREIVSTRMSIPEGSITAATIERENRIKQIKDAKKPRVAPMMAKTLKSIGKLRFRR